MGNIALLGGAAMEVAGVRPRGIDLDILGKFDDACHFMSGRPGQLTALFPIKENKWVAKYLDCSPVEAEIAWAGTTSEELLNYIEFDPATRRVEKNKAWSFDVPENFLCPSINVLLTLKLSHRYLRNSPHFLKTMHDIWALRRAGATVPPALEGWLKRREAETYDYAHPKLNVDKQTFFKDDNITYVYDHDDIHEAVKHLPKPAYQYFKHPEQEVLTSREQFFKCAREVQLYAVLEEAYVLAIERSLVPYPGALDIRQAFSKALSKICTSITSGWFREFAWENYFDVDALYSSDYWPRFQRAVSMGLVRPHSAPTGAAKAG